MSVNGRIDSVTRRRFLRTGVGVLGAAAGGALTAPLGCVTAADRPADEQPNIVFILADDLGWGDLGCYGQQRLRTPHLDRMAEEGMRFTQHYAGSTVCAPSRCVLLTGLHTGHARIRGNGPAVLTDEDVTFVQRLGDAGYATGCVGKWGVGNPPPLDDPRRRGFDEFYGYISMWHAHNCYPAFLIRNGERVPLRNEVAEKWKGGDGRGVATRKVDYAPDLLAEEARAFVERNRRRPFFLFWSLNVPHANNEAGRQGIEVPDQGPFADEDWPEQEKNFAAVVHRMDRDVGRLLALLDDLGLAENTLVIFTSDNGPHQEGGHRAEFFNSNGPLRGKKRDLYEGGIRVPALARWPGRVPAGRITHHISGFQDYVPTFCELAGVTPPETDGLSMVPALLGRPGEQTPHEVLYWEFHERGFSQAIRFGEWKAVRNHHLGAPIGLYHVAADLREDHEVARYCPAEAREAKRLLEGARTPSDLFPIREWKPEA